MKLFQIGKLHSNLWRFHDEKKWPELLACCVSFLVILGFPRKKAVGASRHVLKTFQYADLARNCQLSGDSTREDYYYSKIKNEFVSAHNLLGQETASVQFRVGWIRAYRHSNLFSILLNLLLEHYFKFGLFRPILVARSTFTMFFEIRLAHRNHNWQKLSRAFFNYWSPISSSFPNQPLPLQF
ncbi:hypothetical protein HY572_01900 [Candidatus Micrarchaeota archaeon]|nr:hypothetical protein [Candidatus Micrarchaeota archaeon]